MKCAPLSPPSSSGWIILGASSPIARGFAACAARNGAALILAGRDREALERDAQDCALRFGVDVAARHFDAMELAEHAGFAAECRARIAGTLNIFLAAGAMPAQEEVERDFTQLQRALTTNAVGAASVLLAFAPFLEHQATGTIVALGSVAGDRGRPKNFVYGMGKAGLHVFLQGLRGRLARSGVHVLTVKPGFVDTRMTFGMAGVFLVAQPEACAEACWAAAQRKRNVIYVPSFWRPLMLLIKAIPESLFKRLDI